MLVMTSSLAVKPTDRVNNYSSHLAFEVIFFARGISQIVKYQDLQMFYSHHMNSGPGERAVPRSVKKLLPLRGAMAHHPTQCLYIAS